MVLAPQVPGRTSRREIDVRRRLAAASGWPSSPALVTEARCARQDRGVVDVAVDDPDDPRIAVFMGLRDHDLRRLREAPGGDMEGVFVTEGLLVTARALAAGYRPLAVLVDARRDDPLPDGFPPEVPVHRAGPAVVQAVTGYQTHRGALVTFARRRAPDGRRGPPPTPGGSSWARAIVNPTNLGVILRSAAALGFDGILLDPSSCDPLYRRANRASMGEGFALPHARLAALPDGLAPLRPGRVHGGGPHAGGRRRAPPRPSPPAPAPTTASPSSSAPRAPGSPPPPRPPPTCGSRIPLAAGRGLAQRRGGRRHRLLRPGPGAGRVPGPLVSRPDEGGPVDHEHGDARSGRRSAAASVPWERLATLALSVALVALTIVPLARWSDTSRLLRGWGVDPVVFLGLGVVTLPAFWWSAYGVKTALFAGDWRRGVVSGGRQPRRRDHPPVLRCRGRGRPALVRPAADRRRRHHQRGDPGPAHPPTPTTLRGGARGQRSRSAGGHRGRLAGDRRLTAHLPSLVARRCLP